MSLEFRCFPLVLNPQPIWNLFYYVEEIKSLFIFSSKDRVIWKVWLHISVILVSTRANFLHGYYVQWPPGTPSRRASCAWFHVLLCCHLEILPGSVFLVAVWKWIPMTQLGGPQYMLPSPSCSQLQLPRPLCAAPAQLLPPPSLLCNLISITKITKM